MNRVSATELKNKVADVLNRVVYSKTETIIMRHGKPIAVISPVEKREPNKTTIADFSDVVRERRSSRSFFKLAGILSDAQAKRLRRIVREGRRDGSRHKKFLLK